jgi:hypothetical protein
VALAGAAAAVALAGAAAGAVSAAIAGMARRLSALVEPIKTNNDAFTKQRDVKDFPEEIKFGMVVSNTWLIYYLRVIIARTTLIAINIIALFKPFMPEHQPY